MSPLTGCNHATSVTVPIPTVSATVAGIIARTTRSPTESMSALETATQAPADAASMRATVEAIAATASEVAYFYRDTEGDIWVTGGPVLVGGGVPRLDANGDPVVLFL